MEEKSLQLFTLFNENILANIESLANVREKNTKLEIYFSW